MFHCKSVNTRQLVKNFPEMQKTLGQEDPLEEG